MAANSYEYHSDPYFEKIGIRLGDLQAKDIQLFYALQLERVSANTVIHYHAVIHSTSASAGVAEAQNPCRCGRFGQPIHVQLSPGNVNDVTVAQHLLETVGLQPGKTVLADKAYDKWALREYMADCGADFCIPPRSMSLILGLWIGVFIRSVIWSKSFSSNSNNSVVSRLALTSWLPASLPLSIWLLFVFFVHNSSAYAF